MLSRGDSQKLDSGRTRSGGSHKDALHTWLRWNSCEYRLAYVYFFSSLAVSSLEMEDVRTLALISPRVCVEGLLPRKTATFDPDGPVSAISRRRLERRGPRKTEPAVGRQPRSGSAGLLPSRRLARRRRAPLQEGVMDQMRRGGGRFLGRPIDLAALFFLVSSRPPSHREDKGCLQRRDGEKDQQEKPCYTRALLWSRAAC